MHIATLDVQVSKQLKVRNQLFGNHKKLTNGRIEKLEIISRKLCHTNAVIHIKSSMSGNQHDVVEKKKKLGLGEKNEINVARLSVLRGRVILKNLE